jgi:large subunit ribosomal protein L4
MELGLHGGMGVLQVADALFDATFNEPLVHQVIVAYRAAARSGTKAQKTRAMVSGGNSKPWRQKGTGRARAGSTRGPLWRTGGRAFAAQPRSFAQKINRKMYQGALRSILSELVREGRLVIVESLRADTPKTKELLAKLQAMQLKDVLLVVEALESNLLLAARNLPHVDVIAENELDPVSLIGFSHVVLTTGALRKIEERLA